jgi:DNA-binding LacI/PurR family transcriptional regulator
VRIFFNSNHISRTGDSPFWGILCGLILREAQARSVENQYTYGFDLVPASYFHDPGVTDELIKNYQDGQVHGIVAVGMGEYPTLREMDSTIPVVTYADYGHWRVLSNIEEAIGQGIDALAEMGCRRIAVWNPMEGTEEDSLDGKPIISRLAEIFGDRKVPFFPEFSRRPRAILESRESHEHLSFQQRGYLVAMKAFTEAGVKPDGMFLTDDMLAFGVLTAFAELGIRPGVDIQMVSMSNAGSPILFGYEDVIAFAEYDPAEMAKALFDTLDVLMAGRAPDREMTTVKAKLIKPGDRSWRDEVRRWARS